MRFFSNRRGESDQSAGERDGRQSSSCRVLLDGHIVGSASGGGDATFVVDLGGGDVPVSEQFLGLADIDPGAEEQGRRRGPQRVGRVRAGDYLTGVIVRGPGVAWQALEIAHDEAVLILGHDADLRSAGVHELGRDLIDELTTNPGRVKGTDQGAAIRICQAAFRVLGFGRRHLTRMAQRRTRLCTPRVPSLRTRCMTSLVTIAAA
jgi:hypothetical protein